MPVTLLPAIDIRAGRSVLRTPDGADDPVAVAWWLAEQGAEWLHVVDLDAAFGGRDDGRPFITAVADAPGLPVQASGGVRSDRAFRLRSIAARLA